MAFDRGLWLTQLCHRSFFSCKGQYALKCVNQPHQLVHQQHQLRTDGPIDELGYQSHLLSVRMVSTLSRSSHLSPALAYDSLSRYKFNTYTYTFTLRQSIVKSYLQYSSAPSADHLISPQFSRMTLYRDTSSTLALTLTLTLNTLRQSIVDLYLEYSGFHAFRNGNQNSLYIYYYIIILLYI